VTLDDAIARLRESLPDSLGAWRAAAALDDLEAAWAEEKDGHARMVEMNLSLLRDVENAGCPSCASWRRMMNEED
jgi:hypothetical protein